MSAHLSDSYLEEKKRHLPHAVPVRKGDIVKIMRGDDAGKEGKVATVDYRALRITIEGITHAKADGTQLAMAVTVFPESARGTAEGHRPFDLQPQSTMTNATVADVVAAPAGRRLRLKYKDGEKIIVVPPGAPIVSFRPGDRSLLVPGASVSLTAQAIDGKPTALRINAGRNGFALPY